MPIEHKIYSYTFAELSEEAQQAAVTNIAEKLSGDWWNSADNEDVADTIVMSLATALGTPGAENYGEGDFPGIDGVTLESWSCGYVQSDSIGFAGNLTRENAPKLPWADGIASVTLDVSPNGHTRTWFVMDEAECICDGFSSVREPDCEAHTDSQVAEYVIDILRSAVQSTISAAHKSGYAQVDYIGSEENAREWIENGEPSFNEDGSLFSL